MQEDVRKLYRSMGLNETQIDIIANGQQKRDYFYASNTQSREFQLALGKFTLAFVGVSDPKTLQTIYELEAKNPDGWVDDWLHLNKLSYPDGFEY